MRPISRLVGPLDSDVTPCHSAAASQRHSGGRGSYSAPEVAVRRANVLTRTWCRNCNRDAASYWLRHSSELWPFIRASVSIQLPIQAPFAIRHVDSSSCPLMHSSTSFTDLNNRYSCSTLLRRKKRTLPNAMGLVNQHTHKSVYYNNEVEQKKQNIRSPSFCVEVSTVHPDFPKPKRQPPRPSFVKSPFWTL